ncbi:MAG: hypothetical protein P8099_00955 [Gemmatimonadota bacterium]|jgi:hypothetical protein
MTKARTITAAVAGAGLVLLVGIAAAPQQAPPQLKVDELASQLGLTPQAQKQIAPRVDELNGLLVRADKARQEHQQLWTQLQDVEGKILESLTPTQRQQFAVALGQAWGYGAAGQRGGYMGGYMGSGRMGYGPGSMMGPGRMGYGPGHMVGPGGMGYGPMGYGPMGYGHMGYGGMGRGGMRGGHWGGMHGMWGWRSAPQDSSNSNQGGPR